MFHWLGRVAVYPPKHLPYSGKFSRVLIFTVFTDRLRSAKIKTSKFYPSWPLCDSYVRIVNFSHMTFSQTAGVSESEIEMALLKYFAPSKTFSVRMCIRKHRACLWVWLHLPGLSSKIKAWKHSK